MPLGDRDILKADPEDGTTPIANLLLEALAIARLTGKEKGIILYLWRRTYGWVKNAKRLKEKAISLGEFAKVVCLSDKDTANASKLLAGLVKKNILKRDFGGPGKGYVYSMNTRVGEWDKGCVNLQLLSQITIQPLYKMTMQPLSKGTTPPDTNLVSGKEILNKVKKRNKDIDMDKKAKEIWEKCLEEIKAQVNQTNFRSFYKDTVGLLIEAGVFIIGVPREGAAEYLMEHQRSLIERTLIGVTGKRLGVGYRIIKKEIPSET